jgi:glycosyltransferase involved in cell wall biosynthesis
VRYSNSTRIRIGIEAANIRAGGGVTHLVQILRNLQPDELGIGSVLVWCSRGVAERLPSRPWLRIETPAALERRLPSRLFWLNKTLEGLAERHCDVLFAPGGTFLGRTRPLVAACQNLLPFDATERRRFSWTRDRARLHALALTQGTTFRRAQAVIFPSHTALRVTERAIGPLGPRGRVVPHGAPLPGVQRSQGAHEPHDSTFRLLVVSGIHRYKHPARVVRAVGRLRHQGVPVQLRFVGPVGNAASYRQMTDAMREVDPDGVFVTYTGPAGPEALPAIYQSADVLVFASTCETFGIVLVEAMAHGLPVACSTRSACPEVAGDAAEYFDPEDPGELERALLRLAQEPARRRELATLGYEQAAQFSWENCARDTFQILAEVARS